MKRFIQLKAFAMLACLMCSMNAIAKEAYAEYNSENNTLTFFYDDQRSSRTGITYDLNTGNDQPDWCDNNTCQVVFHPSFAGARPTSTYKWFAYMYNLNSISGLEYLNTSQVTNMGYMFYRCDNLTSLDVSTFNTENVTNMSHMFELCDELTSLDLRNFNTRNVVNMSYMFSACNKLTSLDLSSFNTSKVSDMSFMFNELLVLTDLDVSSFNTENTYLFNYMFNLCLALTNLDVSNFYVEKATSLRGMFQRCESLTSLDLTHFDPRNTLDKIYMFYGCTNLTTIYADCDWFNNIGYYAHAYSTGMFENCTSLVGEKGTTYDANYVDIAYAHIDEGPSNPGYFTQGVPNEAYACYTPSNNKLTFYYDKLRKFRKGRTYDLNENDNYPAWYNDNIHTDVTCVAFDRSFAGARPTTTFAWFYSMANLQTIEGMEDYLYTSKVTNMASMFSGCSNLDTLDLSNFKTVNVTSMRQMFSGCSNLKSIDLSSFNTYRVTNMGGMFSGCSNLISLNLSNFNTAKVTEMSSMFNGCECLNSLDLSSFNTDIVTNMASMFRDCGCLKSLDLSNFNTAKVISMRHMFNKCTNMEAIYVSSTWSTDSVSTITSAMMFNDCISLVGGMGTVYDPNHTNKEYARIDRGPSNPGYFSIVPTFMPGDVNGDEKVSIADVAVLIDLLTSGVMAPAAADVNQDGKLSISDVATLIDLIMNNDI